MAIKLTVNYAKKLGLPGYSSHSFSASIEVEIADVNHAPREIEELYATLQTNVDQHLLQSPGFIPPDNYGMTTPTTYAPSQKQLPVPGNVHSINDHPDQWKCSGKQRIFIEKLTTERGLTKEYVEQLARESFSQEIQSLNKLQASSLIDLLFSEGVAQAQQKSYKGGAPCA